jgi:hypothetical protein
MVDMSVNKESMINEGSTGYFNKGGVIPFIDGSMKFTSEAYDLDIGLHPPFQILKKWHVVEILKRENERPSTFAEAKDKIEQEIMPSWQEAIIKDYLLEARKQHKVEMYGKFGPGKGLSADELFTQAMTITDPERKIELLNLIYTDYPESGRGDDALFMAANIILDTWRDARKAERYLNMLLKDYPDSELFEDATFLRDNLYNSRGLNPKSIEELRDEAQ